MCSINQELSFSKCLIIYICDLIKLSTSIMLSFNVYYIFFDEMIAHCLNLKDICLQFFVRCFTCNSKRKRKKVNYN